MQPIEVIRRGGEPGSVVRNGESWSCGGPVAEKRATLDSVGNYVVGEVTAVLGLPAVVSGNDGREMWVGGRRDPPL